MLKVIVADDMEMIREGIKAMLEQLHSGAGALEIRTASSGAEAVLETEHRRPPSSGSRATEISPSSTGTCSSEAQPQRSGMAGATSSRFPAASG